MKRVFVLLAAAALAITGCASPRNAYQTGNGCVFFRGTRIIIALLFAACLYSCAPSKARQLYCQPMVKTLTGYEKAGPEYPVNILPGDTIKVVYPKNK